MKKNLFTIGLYDKDTEKQEISTPEAKEKVAEILIESATLHKGDRILAIGATTGVVETVVSELRVDLKPADEASKGTYCSVPIDFSLDTDRLKDDNTPVRKLRRGDRIYIWE